MLALSRKANESIILGHDVEITILEIKGDQVKIPLSSKRDVAEAILKITGVNDAR